MLKFFFQASDDGDRVECSTWFHVYGKIPLLVLSHMHVCVCVVSVSVHHRAMCVCVRVCLRSMITTDHHTVFKIARWVHALETSLSKLLK